METAESRPPALGRGGGEDFSDKMTTQKCEEIKKLSCEYLAHNFLIY